MYRRQRSRPSPRKRNAKRQNGYLRRPYKLAEKRREAKGKGEKERYTHLNAELQRRARRDKKAFLSDQQTVAIHYCWLGVGGRTSQIFLK